jgi:hypothetical protein
MIHLDSPVVLICLLLVLGVLTPLSRFLRKRSLFGVVTDLDGHPLHTARVEIRNLSNGRTLRDVTDDQGRFYFGGLSPSAGYELSVLHRDHGSASTEIRPQSSDCELHLELGARRSIARLRVVRENTVDSFSPDVV